MSQPSGILALQIWIFEPGKNHAFYTAAIELPPQASRTPYSEQGAKDVKNQITEFWSHIAEMHMKGMISVSLDSLIYPYIEKW